MPDTVNDYAQKKFEELRSKFKLDIQKPLLKKTIELTQQKIDEMSSAEKNELYDVQSEFSTGVNKAVENSREIDQTFDFIGSLNLPPKLSLAIGLIISGHKTRNKEDIANALVALGEYCNE